MKKKNLMGLVLAGVLAFAPAASVCAEESRRRWYMEAEIIPELIRQWMNMEKLIS